MLGNQVFHIRVATGTEHIDYLVLPISSRPDDGVCGERSWLAEEAFPRILLEHLLVSRRAQEVFHAGGAVNPGKRNSNLIYSREREKKELLFTLDNLLCRRWSPSQRRRTRCNKTGRSRGNRNSLIIKTRWDEAKYLRIWSRYRKRTYRVYIVPGTKIFLVREYSKEQGFEKREKVVLYRTIFAQRSLEERMNVHFVVGNSKALEAQRVERDFPFYRRSQVIWGSRAFV